MYVACHNREGDLEELFAHENRAYSPSLSIYGEMRSSEASSVKPDFTAEVLDDAQQILVSIARTSLLNIYSTNIAKLP